jgi:hypothetical protein
MAISLLVAVPNRSFEKMKKVKATTEDETLKLEIDTKGMNPTQVRLLKSWNTLMAHVLLTHQEDEFFDGSAEVIRICAALVKQSNFASLTKSEIPYAEQVLQYSMEILQEHMEEEKVVSYDN